MSHPYAESRKRARKRWRQSPKGKAWDKAYNQRPKVKARKKEYLIKRIIKELANENANRDYLVYEVTGKNFSIRTSIRRYASTQ